MAIEPWVLQQQAMQGLLTDTQAGQAGPASTAPQPGEVLEVLELASTLGFTIFSSIFGAVTAINAQTGQIDTASGTVAAADAGTLSAAPPAELGRAAAQTDFQLKEPGVGWKDELPTWLTPTTIIIGAGALVALSLATRR